MSKQRFEFGKNWRSFLAALSEERIEVAVESLQQMLGTESLTGKRFLDVGCGSGLFSLAADRLGAAVDSIDFDAESVACTRELKNRYGSASPDWEIRQGSVLDESLMQSLGQADVVYSWGVLHHTGDIDRAIRIASQATRPGGLFCIAIYNDQGAASRRWLAVKQVYNRLPKVLQPAWVVLIAGIYECKFALARLSKFQNPLPLADWRAKKDDRGMSAWHDWVDWVGGLPFEVATPAKIEAMLGQQGFKLERSKLIGKGWGCNEFVFARTEEVV
jgi:2-polyprenyl-6-hydroxyphenyl methylase/3-demethylubiquinone-9 3-methyltransferase